MSSAAMAAPLPDAAQSQTSVSTDARLWPLAALALLLVAQASLGFTRAVNWDEFYFYNQIAAFAGGELESPLQTFNTRLFFWLPGLFQSSVDHIVAARLVMILFEAATLVGLFAIARRFTDRVTALFVPLLYLSAGNVFQHGASFRVDPMATALLVGSLAVFTRSRLDAKAVIAFGLLAGLAVMITIKVVLYLPAFAGLALMRLIEANWARGVFTRLILCGVAAILAFAGLFLWHSAAVTGGSQAVNAPPTLLSDSLSWMFVLGLPQYWQMAVKSAMLAPVFFAAIIASPVLLARSDRSRAEKAALIGLWLPVFTPFFYTNSAAYFYAFMLAPVALGCIPALEWARERFSPMLMTVALAAVTLTVFAVEDRSTINRQRQLDADVRAIFPQPVTYFDHNYMMGGWPKANRFMTPWGLQKYRDAGQPAYRMAMERETVPLLLANWEGLQDIMERGDNSILLPRDTAALRDNYIALTPFIYVAGQEFAAGADVQHEFLVPGNYTVRGGAMTVDGIQVEPGEIVEITRGIHSIAVGEGGDASLAWGDNPQVPEDALRDGPIYVGF